MIAFPLRVFHAVYGQQGLMALRPQRNHPESVFKRGHLLVQQLVLDRHDVRSRMKLIHDLGCEMGGKLYLHPHQPVLHLFPHGILETGIQLFGQCLLERIVNRESLPDSQEMPVVDFHDFLVYDGHHVVVLEKRADGVLLYMFPFINSPLHDDLFSLYGPFRTGKQEQVFIAFRKVREIKIEREISEVVDGIVHHHAEPYGTRGHPAFRTGNHGFLQGMVYPVQDVIADHVPYVGLMQQRVTRRIERYASCRQLPAQ
nr:hypothetical protein [Bacteroides thetaiotaomicron]